MSERRKTDGSGDDPGLPEVLKGDLRATELGRDVLRDLRGLYHFYLDDERRVQLAGMGRIRRAFALIGWAVKSMLMKLSPARRILLVAAIALTILGETSSTLGMSYVNVDFRPWGAAILLLVLMLELKDKLLAKDEIQVAREVQLALLPQPDLSLPGWEIWSCSQPANDVGGDLVDYFELDDFRHAVVLGDVAGKGLGAALLTAKLQATLRAIGGDSPSLADLGTRINSILYRDGLANRYATMFLIALEHHAGHVRYLNAGHNPAYVVRRDRIERLPASSYPLGMLPEASYEEGALDLTEGDVLLVYSDGLTEATAESGEEFGEKRLEALLPALRELAPQQIGEGIAREVDRFVGDSRLHDDMSMAIIKK